MPTYFSDHFALPAAGTVIPPTVLPLASIKADPGLAGASIRSLNARMDFSALASTLTAGDQFRLFTMQSGDMIHRINIVNTSGGATNDWNYVSILLDLGVFESGVAHDGVVRDVNLFSPALDIGSDETWPVAAVYDNAFITGVLDGTDRGLKLWELINIGVPSTYTQDPKIQFDIVASVNTATTFTANGLLSFNVQYCPAAVN